MRLSDVVRRDEVMVEELRRFVERGETPGVSFRQAMEFLLSDGVFPESGLPLASFLRIEDWARQRLRSASSSAPDHAGNPRNLGFGFTRTAR